MSKDDPRSKTLDAFRARTDPEDPRYNRLDPDRRRKIVKAYALLDPKRLKTDDCIRFVRKDCHKNSLSHFLDTATPAQIDQLERMLEL